MKKKHGKCDDCLYTVTSNDKKTILCAHNTGKFFKMSGSDGCKHFTSSKVNKIALGLIFIAIAIYLSGMGFIIYDAIAKR